MSSIASEADIEKLVVDVCAANGWKYRPAAGIGRPERSVLLEGQFKEALKRLNPCIAENPDYADAVVYRLRSLINTVLPLSSHGQKLALRSLVVLFDDGTGLPPLLRSAARGGARPRRGAAKRRARDQCGTA